MTEFYFFDTCAIIEVLKGNPKYLRYRNAKIILTKMNLFELYYFLLRKVGSKIAEETLLEYSKFLVDYDLDVITIAAKLKYLHKKRKLSMADCVGYILSKKYQIPYLTSDEQFNDLDGVEFVR